MKYCENHVFVWRLSYFYVFFWLLTWVAHQAPLSMVAFSRVTSGRLHFGTSTFTIIERNIKAIFREYFSSLCFDSGKIFMMIIWIIFSCRPRTTYCIVLFSLDTFTIKCGWKVHCTVKTVVFFLTSNYLLWAPNNSNPWIKLGGECKNASFSKLKIQILRFETRFIRGSSSAPVLSRHASLQAGTEGIHLR